MAQLFHELELKTTERSQLVDVTARVQDAVGRSGVQAGLCVVWCPHTTAAVTVNENADPDVAGDVLRHLELVVPHRQPEFRHAEGNSDSHIKSILTGPSVTLIVRDGHLALGTWQGVFLCEFDGPRTRQLWVQLVDSRPAEGR